MNRPKAKQSEKEHAQLIKESLRNAFPNHLTLVQEFIKESDPEFDPKFWGKFRAPKELQAEFLRWSGLAQPTPEVQAKPTVATTPKSTPEVSLDDQFAELAVEIADLPKTRRESPREFDSRVVSLTQRLQSLIGLLQDRP